MKRIATLATLVAATVLASGQGTGGPLALTLSEAVLVALRNSPALRVQTLSLSLTRTSEKEEEAAFDPVLSAGFARTWNAAGVGGAPAADETTVDAGASVLLAPGTSVSAGVDATWTDERSSGIDLAVTQPLLNGAFGAVNLAKVRQARIDSFSSRYELESFTAVLLADVETAYWDLYLAGAQLAIMRESLSLAERQLEETRARVDVGRLPEIELAAALAEVASRREALLVGEAGVETARVRLVRLLNPPGEGRWEREVRVTDTPGLPPDDMGDIRGAVAVGLRARSDLAQARLAIERGDLELVRTRNGLLPKLDVFLSGSGSGSAGTLVGSLPDLFVQPELSAGVRFELPLGNRAASARDERAAISRRRAEEALRNLELLAEADIRTAHIEARRAFRQIEATETVRALQGQKLAAETEKFRVGTSTAFLVAQAQRDLLNSQLSAVAASVGYLQALVRLYRSEGTLLAKKGIEVPDGGAAAAP